MRSRSGVVLSLLAVFVVLCALHYHLLRLPYFWDEAGYFVPAAWDFYRTGTLIPESTLPSGHTPLVMAYLGLTWRLFGFFPLVTRSAMLLVAAATVASLYALGRAITGREPAVWSASLLALSPLFFAQSALVHLDLAAGLFTTLAVLALLGRRIAWFALAASLAVLSKETAVVLLPVAWAFAWRTRKELPRGTWIGLAFPVLPLLAWAVYYHYSTGFWTGNPEYLDYNLYSNLNPFRFLWTLPRRLYEVFIGGFNWLLTAGAVAGIWWGRKPGRTHGRGSPPGLSKGASAEGRPVEARPILERNFFFLASCLCGVYVFVFSLLGGAILPRYLLPLFPVVFLAGVLLLWRLPAAAARTLSVVLAGCLIAGWFINPPWPFPYEDNLAYADFIRLHQRAAEFLEIQAGNARVLTAWPALDELTKPFLGYVRKPLRTTSLKSFTADDFASVPPESFDLLYLYSLKWQPKQNWLTRSPQFQKFLERFLDVAPPIPEDLLVARYRLKLLQSFERRGQWVRIYGKESPSAGYSFPLERGVDSSPVKRSVDNGFTPFHVEPGQHSPADFRTRRGDTRSP